MCPSVLTHWHLGDLKGILDNLKLILVIDGSGISCEIVISAYSSKVNIGSGNGLVPSDNKPLPESMLM